MEDIYDFGLRLKSLRKLKKLSQENVADRIGVTKSTISAYERNLKMPSVETITKLAILYNASIDYILGLENRSYLYLDDLPKEKQTSILKVVELLKNEF